ncbi:AfsR/SARP family transcriptional regulator, partial [Nonomuraea lactucae]|uniref:AfsR/SARP family transcriptional regulator n=1 Tax=Nonomuraea lactucae TaxID=2249762 RepID=UPI0013B44802
MKGVSSDTVMTFAVLGPLEVRRDGQVVEVTGQRLRTLLGLLVLDAGVTVPFERLIAGVWEDDPPGVVDNALQALVSRLRTALAKGTAPAKDAALAEGTVLAKGAALAEGTALAKGAALAEGSAHDSPRPAVPESRARQLVLADPTGYRLAADPEQVDAHRFARLARRGRAALTSGDALAAAGLLREALALWR